MIVRFLGLALIWCLPCVAMATPTHQDNIQIASDRITDLMISEGVAGVSVAVAVDGELVWSEGFGLANKQTGLPANGGTAHSIASISKPFTALAVMSLVEDGVLDLDAPVNNYLDEAQITARIGDGDDVTLRMLLNHTSGLPAHHSFFYEDEDYERLSYEESLRQFAILVNAPGEIFEYSNYGFGIVEYVIERQTGETFEQVVHDRIVAPLGLQNTFLPTRNPETDPTHDNVAVRYRNTGQAVPFFDFYHRGAAAMYSSMEDLVRLGLAYSDALKGQSGFMTEASAQEMLESPVEISTFPWSFGLGWQVRDVNGNRVLTHAGGMPGTRSRLLIAPDKGVVIAVALNADTMAYENIVSTLTQLFAPELYDQSSLAGVVDAMAGEWSGAADLGDYGALPITLSIIDGESLSAVLNGVPIHLDEIMQGRQGYFHLVFHDGHIPTPLAERYPHRISLKIRKRGQRLTGYILTENRPQTDRIGSALGYWVEFSADTDPQGPN